MSWTPDKYEYASTIQGCDMSDSNMNSSINFSLKIFKIVLSKQVRTVREDWIEIFTHFVCRARNGQALVILHCLRISMHLYEPSQRWSQLL